MNCMKLSAGTDWNDQRKAGTLAQLSRRGALFCCWWISWASPICQPVSVPCNQNPFQTPFQNFSWPFPLSVGCPLQWKILSRQNTNHLSSSPFHLQLPLANVLWIDNQAQREVSPLPDSVKSCFPSPTRHCSMDQLFTLWCSPVGLMAHWPRSKPHCGQWDLLSGEKNWKCERHYSYPVNNNYIYGKLLFCGSLRLGGGRLVDQLLRSYLQHSWNHFKGRLHLL